MYGAQETPRPPPQTGPVSVEDIRAALAALEPDDPALQAMIDGRRPLDLDVLSRIIENTISFWRIVLKDRRLGLWLALVHFFEQREAWEEGATGREEELSRLGGLMLRLLEAECLLPAFVRVAASSVRARSDLNYRPPPTQLERFQEALVRAIDEQTPRMVRCYSSVALVFLEDLIRLESTETMLFFSTCYFRLLEQVVRDLCKEQFKTTSSVRPKLLFKLYTVAKNYDAAAEGGEHFTDAEIYPLVRNEGFAASSSCVRQTTYRDEGGSEHEVVVKYSEWIPLEEVEAIMFVAAKTSISVPQVLAVEQTAREGFGGRLELSNYIYMSLVHGEPLYAACERLFSSAKSALRGDLSSMFSQLRALRPAPGFIGTFLEPFHIVIPLSIASPPHSSRRPCNSHAVTSWLARYRPTPSRPAEPLDAIADFQAQLSSSPPPLPFFHGDIAGRNILVDPDTGRLTGVIDWERAGWWVKGVEEGIVSFDADEDFSEGGHLSSAIFLLDCLSGLSQ
ncbi:hypothetical protein JCM6882_005450 [Rhodosporidiobolus microsporus]